MPHCLKYFLLLCACAGAMGCGPRATTVTAEQPSRREIQRNAMRSESWQFVDCSDNQELRALLTEIADSRPMDKTITVVSCNDWQPNVPSVVFGDRLPEELVDFPLKRNIFNDSLEVTEGDVLLLHEYLNPLSLSDTMPTTVSLFYAPDPQALPAFLRDYLGERMWSIFRGRWAYELYKSDGSKYLGNYDNRTGWAYSTDDQIIMRPPGEPIYDQKGISIYACDEHPDQKEVDRVVGAICRIRELLSAAPNRKSGEAQRINLYPSVERIGLRLGDMEPIQLVDDQLHLVPSFVTSKDLLNSEAMWRAALLHLNVANADSIDVADLKKEYSSQLPELTDKPGIVKQSMPSQYLCGMTVAHEGYSVYNGYGGSRLDRSLDSLSEIKANAVSIVPYSFMRDPRQPSALPVPEGGGGENDPSVIHAIRQAKARGYFVLLKPQIWIRGAWPGEVDFATDGEWETFFTEYEEWILHYAELAEREGAESLCLGTELVKTTLKHPDRWKKIIAEVRKVYGGSLTYAANWGEEFEGLTFWADLDAIGLNSYYPLSAKEDPSDAELLAGARRWMILADSVSRHYDRPLWLTEVGYRSVDLAWQNPHAEAGERDGDFLAQSRCYSALLAAARESDRLRGMFVWKWPSWLGHDEGEGRNTTGTGFVPGGKPAAALLESFYGEAQR